VRKSDRKREREKERERRERRERESETHLVTNESIPEREDDLIFFTIKVFVLSNTGVSNMWLVYATPNSSKKRTKI